MVYEGVFRGQPVAVKKLRLSTSADLDRFRSELKLLAQLNHPNVVTLVGAHHGHCNMADKLDDWSRFSREIWGAAARRCQGSSSRLHGGAAAAAEQPAAHAVRAGVAPQLGRHTQVRFLLSTAAAHLSSPPATSMLWRSVQHGVVGQPHNAAEVTMSCRRMQHHALSQTPLSALASPNQAWHCSCRCRVCCPRSGHGSP